MSEVVVKIGIIPTQDYTWTYELQSGNDKIKSTLAYKDDYKGWESRVPFEGSEHPDIRGLFLVSIKAAREEGDLIKVTLGFESSDWDSDYPGRLRREKSTERFRVEPSLNDEPILSFKKAAALSKAIKGALNKYLSSERSDADYDTALAAMDGNADAIALLDAARENQDSWRSPQVIWVRSRTVKSLSDIPFASIGKIVTPPQDVNGFPNSVEGYNWMYLAPDISHSADGLSYDVEERFQRSYEGGWKSFFYAP